jgi:hypothetical protein
MAWIVDGLRKGQLAWIYKVYAPPSTPLLYAYRNLFSAIRTTDSISQTPQLPSKNQLLCPNQLHLIYRHIQLHGKTPAQIRPGTLGSASMGLLSSFATGAVLADLMASNLIYKPLFPILFALPLCSLAFVNFLQYPAALQLLLLSLESLFLAPRPPSNCPLDLL